MQKSYDQNDGKPEPEIEIRSSERDQETTFINFKQNVVVLCPEFICLPSKFVTAASISGRQNYTEVSETRTSAVWCLMQKGKKSCPITRFSNQAKTSGFYKELR